MRVVAAFLLLLCVRLAPAASVDVPELYGRHCAACHGPQRYGQTGPALLPESLERLRKADAEKVIREGRAATQMPAFKGVLDDADILALRDYIYAPAGTRPDWTEGDIRASRIEHAKAVDLPAKPRFAADPLNLFIVVEAGDHHITLLDGDRFTPVHRFPTRYALHGGPKFSPDGRFVYLASRDGWIAKYDIWNLRLVAEIRAGINTRNLAVSGDGLHVMVANYLPHTLVALDARDLSLVKVIAVRDDKGRSSRVSAVYDAAPRKSFVAALKDIPEVWELTYDPKAPPVYRGLVHDYRMGEGVAEAGPFPVRVTPLDSVLEDFFFDQPYTHVVGTSREGQSGQVINLDVRRRIASVDIPGMPHLGAGITWRHDGRNVLAAPNLKDGVVTVVDMTGWKLLRQIRTAGPGFFLRSHENSPYAWVDAFNSPKRDTLQIIDKRTLEIAGSVTPSPGRTAAHVEFTRDGRHALVSVWEMDGALVVYDAATFAEVTRLPMRKPAGKYNVWNKVTRSSGTSH